MLCAGSAMNWCGTKLNLKFSKLFIGQQPMYMWREEAFIKFKRRWETDLLNNDFKK